MRKEAKAILGYSPTEKPCLLCLTPDEKISKKDATHWHARFRKGCQVRKCVTTMEIKNCAYCSRFPCDYVESHSGAWNREAYEKLHGRPMTEEEYERYIEPFEALDRLKRVRATVNPNEIDEAPTLPLLKAKIVDFPDEITDPHAANFRQIHSMLKRLKETTLSGVDADLAVQQHRLKNRVKYLFRFLWIFAAHAKLDISNGSTLVIDPAMYKANRGSETGLMTVRTLEGVIFPNLLKVGIKAKMNELTKEWRLPSGYLRVRGWEMRMSFTEKVGRLASLKAFQNYGLALEEKYGKRAFRYFKNVDMSVLVDS
jgi:hypothetical protein